MPAHDPAALVDALGPDPRLDRATALIDQANRHFAQGREAEAWAVLGQADALMAEVRAEQAAVEPPYWLTGGERAAWLAGWKARGGQG